MKIKFNLSAEENGRIKNFEFILDGDNGKGFEPSPSALIGLLASPLKHFGWDCRIRRTSSYPSKSGVLA